MTKALCIVYEKVNDPEGFEGYRTKVTETLEPFGGRFVVRGGAFTVLENEMPWERVVVLEFPSREAAEGWYNSEAYQAVLPIRLAAADALFVVVDALE